MKCGVRLKCWEFLYLSTHYVCLCMTTLAEVFPCFFLSCKANSRVKPAKTGHCPHSSKFLCCSMYFLYCSMYFCVVLCIVCFVSFSVLFVCICALYYWHRVATQLQLNISCHIIYPIISYHIISYHIISYHIISYHIISYHIISYHIMYHISYPVSYRVVSYRIISYHYELPKKTKFLWA